MGATNREAVTTAICSSCDHDCTVAGCVDAERRTHVERIGQGLPHVGHPNGDSAHDAKLEMAYRTTAEVMARDRWR